MTTAFILALIAALALAAVLFFAMNYIRKLERDNVRLAKLWKKDRDRNAEVWNETLAAIKSHCDEVVNRPSCGPATKALIEKYTSDLLGKYEKILKEADNGVHSE